jgi:hypothetical protein
MAETGFCLRLQVEPIQLDPVDRASLLFDTSNNINRGFKTNITQTNKDSWLFHKSLDDG